MAKVGRKEGLLATLLVLLVLAGALSIIGAVVWLRMAPNQSPTQPGQPARPASTLQVPQGAPLAPLPDLESG